MRWNKKIGLLLLGIWLIVGGLMALMPRLSFEGAGSLMAVLAIVAGIFIVLDR